MATTVAFSRVIKEVRDIQNSSDLSMAVATDDTDVRYITALLLGPHDTPYEFGLFEFHIKITQDYPNQPPVVTAITTNGGETRFNPNIYANGKVCLSILGTWQGEASERWTPGQGLESVLVSVHSLLSENPYNNEPGFEKESPKNSLCIDYADKIRHETIRISVCQRLENYLGIEDTVTDLNGRRPKRLKLSENHESEWDNSSISGEEEEDIAEVYGPKTKEEMEKPKKKSASSSLFVTPEPETPPVEPKSELESELYVPNVESYPVDPFKDLCKRRFLWYQARYEATIRREIRKHMMNEPFGRTPFEMGGNSMLGVYQYPKLQERITAIAKALEKERNDWIKRGEEGAARGSRSSAAMQRIFDAAYNEYSQRDEPFSLTLVNGNPHHWRLIIYGRPMSILDGGVFELRIVMPFKSFPEEQPRVKVVTPIFHHSVAPNGVLFYVPQREDSMASHLTAIRERFEDVVPPYDPRARVNPLAFRLYWGDEIQRRLYNRGLRQKVLESSKKT